jgi:CheY-like chemotaxis protein
MLKAMGAPLILQVEDDADDVELMQDAFKDNGLDFAFEVISVGDRVMPWLEKAGRVPKVILMDLNLPKMHGKEILSILKSHPMFKSIPVVILTTSSSREDKEYCLKNGAVKVITKPSTVEGFRETVFLISEVISQSST